MRFLHIGDLHIGKHVNGFSMLEDQQFILDQVLRMAQTHEVDALLLAGDLYDKSTPSAEATAELDRFLTAASKAGLKVFAIPGNHDSAERVGYGQQLMEESGVYVSPAFDGTMAHHVLEDEHGPLHVWMLPFVKPAHVRPFFPEAEIRDYTDAIKQVINASSVLGSSDGQANERHICIAHQFVVSSGAEPERSDSELNIGGLDSVDCSLFDAFDYVALGHIHRPQRIGRDTVRYSGSPLKYSYSEVRYPKSAVLVTMGAAGTEPEWELLPFTPLRDLREIRGTLKELLDPEVVSAANPEDYLHVILTDETPATDVLGRLRQTYPNVMSVDYDNTSTRHVGTAHTAELESVQQLTTFELFQQFFEKQHGKELSERQADIAETAMEKTQEGGVR